MKKPQIETKKYFLTIEAVLAKRIKVAFWLRMSSFFICENEFENSMQFFALWSD